MLIVMLMDTVRLWGIQNVFIPQVYLVQGRVLRKIYLPLPTFLPVVWLDYTRTNNYDNSELKSLGIWVNYRNVTSKIPKNSKGILSRLAFQRNKEWTKI